MVSKKSRTRLTGYIKKEILVATLNKGLTRQEKQEKVEKKCVMCGKPTTNSSGFCNEYLGSAFGCKEMWKQEYGKMPTKDELNAKWRIIK